MVKENKKNKETTTAKLDDATPNTAEPGASATPVAASALPDSSKLPSTSGLHRPKGTETSDAATTTPTSSLPNTTVTRPTEISQPVPALVAQPDPATLQSLQITASSSSVSTTFIKPTDLPDTQVKTEPLPEIKTFPSPYSGLIDSYKTANRPGLPPPLPLPPLPGLIVGYVGQESTYTLPDNWLLNLIERPPALVLPSKLMFQMLETIASPLTELNTQVKDELLTPALETFPRGLGLGSYQLNPAIFESKGSTVTAGVITNDSFVAPFLLQRSGQSVQTNVTSLVSGAVAAAATLALRYRGFLVLDTTDIRQTSGVNAFPSLSWLRDTWIPPATSSPAMIKGLIGLRYVDEAIRNSDRFHFGRSAVLEYLPGNIPYRSRWATTYDNFTVHLLGISQRYIRNNTLSLDNLRAQLYAHAPFGTSFQHVEANAQTFRPLLKHSPEIQVAQLLLAIAKQPSIKPIIAQLYVDYITNSSLLREEPVGDVMASVSGIPAGTPTVQALNARIGRGNQATLIEALAFEIRPTFDYPRTPKQPINDYNDLILCFLETTIFFIFFPKAAKYIGYELCNRLRLILMRLYPIEWGDYTRRVGYRFEMPGSNTEMDRASYLDGDHTPTLLHGPAANNVWNIASRIAGLIQPIGGMMDRARARDAGLPMLDPEIFIPWDDPGDVIGAQTAVTARVREIITFTQSRLLRDLKRAVQQTSGQASTLATVCTAIEAKILSVGNGLGRGVRRLFAGMVDLATNVVHGYDGNLATPLPAPIFLFDNSGIRGAPLAVQALDSNFTLDTGVVWTLIFATGFVFDTAQFLTNDETPMIVFANLPSPMETLASQMNVYAFCERLALPAAFIGLVLSSTPDAPEPYATIRRLMARAKVTPSIFSSGAYKRLITIVAAIIDESTVGHESVSGLINQHLSGDNRYSQPIFRRRSPLSMPIPPNPADPAVLQGVPLLMDGMYSEMFEFGLTMLLHPLSALSRVGTGFALYRQMMNDVLFSDIFQDPGWPQFELTSDNFVVIDRDGFPVQALRVNQVDYVSPRELPQSTFIIHDPGVFTAQQVMFLVQAVTDGQAAIVFPDVIYLYTIHVVDRAAFAHHVRTTPLNTLIESISTTVAHIPLFSTVEIDRSGLKFITPYCERYVFPLVAPNITISFSNIFGLNPDPFFNGPRPSLYETGTLSDDWRNTLENGVQKRFTTLYMANEMIYHERREGFYQLPKIECQLPDQLITAGFLGN